MAPAIQNRGRRLGRRLSTPMFSMALVLAVPPPCRPFPLLLQKFESQSNQPFRHLRHLPEEVAVMLAPSVVKVLSVVRNCRRLADVLSPTLGAPPALLF